MVWLAGAVSRTSFGKFGNSDKADIMESVSFNFPHMKQAVTAGRGAEMSREISGVTLETLPSAVRKIGLRRDQKFTLVVEDEEDERRNAYNRMQEIAAAVTARAQADGIITDEDVEKFLES
jgi:5-carboxymethyl-2-hydroxymuconate isomerase